MLKNHSNSNFSRIKPAYLKQLQQSLSVCEDTFVSDDPLNPKIEDCTAWYNRGDAFANLGCYENALACFNKAVEVQPRDHAAWVFRGVVLIHLNCYEEALASCEQALEIQPDSKEAWVFRGAALHYLGRYKQAYASYDEALGINGKSAD